MHIETAISVLENIVNYTRDNNIGDNDGKDNVVIVVPFKLLENHLKIYSSKDYTIILEDFENLYSFLIKQGRYIAKKSLKIKWSFNIMSRDRYDRDKRRATNFFPRLQQPAHYTSSLFVLYREPEIIKNDVVIEGYYNITKRLHKEIKTCYKVNSYGTLNKFICYLSFYFAKISR